MPSSLNKVTKTISRKRQGKAGKSTSLNALHENSRDAKRIRRAASRDQKVLRQEKTRRERDGRLLSRMAFFHAALQMPGSTTVPSLHALVQQFLSRHTAELEEHVAQRRSGRPKTARHVALEALKDVEEKEYDTGFWTLDTRDPDNARKFVRDWSGEWGGLGQFKFVRVRRLKEGEGAMDDAPGEEVGVTESGFPPTAGV